MKYSFRFLIIALGLSLANCTVTERILFNEDGSGTFVAEYEMGKVMEQMKGAFEDLNSNEEDDDDNDDNEKNGDIAETKKKEVVMDTTMYYKDILAEKKDSISKLPLAQQKAFEAIEDMFMRMKMDMDNDIFIMGIGMEFTSVEDLKGIQKKLEEAKKMNQNQNQVAGGMTESPMYNALSGDQGQNVVYDLTDSRFSRKTTIDVDPEELFKMEELDDAGELKDNFEESYYILEYTFPKKIKSFTKDSAEISEDGKTLIYKINWLEFLQDPFMLDLDIEFVDE